MKTHLYVNDLPEGLDLGKSIAIDTETMGLNHSRDRLCLVQISSGNGEAHLVHFPKKIYNAPHLKSLLSDRDVMKIFHFARFDVATLQHYLNIEIDNIFCTKIASKISRTFSNYHGLKDLCLTLLDVKISKQQQLSDWGQEKLTTEQIEYASNDVLYLHQLKKCLEALLKREGKMKLAQQCFGFIPALAQMDVLNWGYNVLEH